jgi:hypothetical protein
MLLPMSYEFLEHSCPEYNPSPYAMDGYHKLASLVSDHEELLILRRFATANAKNLLYMQAEILHLEAELHDIALEDHSGCEKHRNYEYCVFDLKESCRTRGSDAQWQKILELREKLKDYSQSILHIQNHQTLKTGVQMTLCSGTTRSAACRRPTREI